jgi:hypothetical protein
MINSANHSYQYCCLSFFRSRYTLRGHEVTDGEADELVGQFYRGEG